MSATPSPSAEAPGTNRARSPRSPIRGPGSLRRRTLRRLRRLTPRTFQARLTVAFGIVVAATLVLVATFVINRVGAYFDQQREDDEDLLDPVQPPRGDAVDRDEVAEQDPDRRFEAVQ